MKKLWNKTWLRGTVYSISGVICFIVLVSLILFYIGRPQKNIVWGLTFSTLHAQELGFDPYQLFTTILNDLHPQKVRLPAYWSEVEPQQGKYDFSKVNALLAETDKRNTGVVLVIGLKEPRWPECHQPDWYNSLNDGQKDQAVLDLITATVDQLKGHNSITAWQVENEPYFAYGPGCPSINQTLYKEELATLRLLDSRPTIGTDSGEKGAWITVAGSGVNILGTTMYREAYYEKQGKYITYPMPWWLYNIKAGLVKLLTKSNDVIGVELQTEPWLKIANPKYTPTDQQLEHMNPEIFQRNINYATSVGLPENYLWGAEWWYWLQKERQDSSMLDAAKKFFNNISTLPNK